MSMIKDGTGSGALAKVSPYNHLYVRSVGIRHRAWKAAQGHAFVLASPLLTVTDTEGLVGWFLYSCPTCKLAIFSIDAYWNGGSTNHNRVCEVEFELGPTMPTTNTDSIVAVNTNVSSSNLLSHTAKVWDGVGTGMTGGAAGASLGMIQCAQGKTRWDVGGGFIIGPNDTLGFKVRGEETGKFSFALWSYELSIEELES